MAKQIDWDLIGAPIRIFGGDPELSNTSWPEDIFDITDQVSSAEHSSAIDFFKKFHLPAIERANIDLSSLNVLEFGAGFGWLAYGTLKSVQPNMYVATDSFRQFLPSLNSLLEKWAPEAASVGAGLFDPQDSLRYSPGTFNVIQAHSVLHHVLDWRGALSNLFKSLASPGIIIMCEPCVDGYQVLQMISKIVRDKFILEDDVEQNLVLMERYVEERTGPARNEESFLKSVGGGDKHLFSTLELMEFATEIGARLHIQREDRGLLSLIPGEFKLRGMTDASAAKVGGYLASLMPGGTDLSLFGDLRQIFCLIK